MTRDELLMRACVQQARLWLGPNAPDDELAYATVIVFGFAAGLWFEISSTIH